MWSNVLCVREYLHMKIKRNKQQSKSLSKLIKLLQTENIVYMLKLVKVENWIFTISFIELPPRKGAWYEFDVSSCC